MQDVCYVCKYAYAPESNSGHFRQRRQSKDRNQNLFTKMLALNKTIREFSIYVLADFCWKLLMIRNLLFWFGKEPQSTA